MNKPQKFLIKITTILVVSMIILCPLITAYLGKTYGYIITNIIYWGVFCIPTIFILIKSSHFKIIDMFKNGLCENKKSKIAYHVFAFFPCFATGGIVFLPVINKAGITPIVIAFFYALINGTIEEVFWRGLFNKIFPGNIKFAFFYPTIMFSMWHISLMLAKGIVYQGGPLTLLFGATFVGILWGLVAYKTGSIKFTVMAHVITNFFAFSGLVYENWFL